jgi:multidrug efflux pump
MNIPEFSVNRKILVNMIFFILVILGMGLYADMPREFFPNANLNEVLVLIPYRGASSLEVEQQIVDKIETAVVELDGLDEILGRAQESMGVIDLRIEDGTDMDKFIIDLQAAVNSVPDLPDEAGDPIYFELDASSVQPVCFLAIGGEVDQSVLLEIAKEVKTEILEIRGVKKVDINGLRDDEVHVKVDPNLMDHYHLSLGEVIAALARRNIDLPGGSGELGRYEYTLRVLGKYEDLTEIENSIVRSDGPGRQIRVKDVARVVMGLEDFNSLDRLNGEPAGKLTIHRKVDSNTLTIMEEVREIVAAYNANLPLPVSLEIRIDSAELIEERLGIMTNNAWLTALLVGGLLFIFLGWTNAVLVLIGIPFTFLTAYLFMSLAGMSINMLTLFALIMALGLIVDDAIVVIDNIQRYIELGLPPRQAAIRGTREVMTPVTAAVLTTIVGFLPMMFMGGMVGKFMSAIPKTVCFALLASLVEAILILPSHTVELNEFYRMIRRKLGLKAKIATGETAADLPAQVTGKISPDAFAPDQPTGHKGLVGGYKVKRKNRVYRQLQRLYRKSLLRVLRYRYLTVLVVIAMVIGSVGLLQQIPVKMFPDEDFDQFAIRFKLPAGTPLKETEKMTLVIEQLVRRQVPEQERKGIVSSTGYQIVNYEYVRGLNLAEVNIDLVSAADRERSDMEIMNNLRRQIALVPGIIEYQLARPDNGPPTGRPVEIRILGPRFAVLEELGEQLKVGLGKIEGVIDIRDDFDRTVRELQVNVDETRASQLGLTNQQVALTVNAAFQGIEATQYTSPSGEEIPVIVRLDEPWRDDLETLQQLKVQTDRGGLVPLTGVADLDRTRNFSVIRHYNRDRAITITADLLPGQTSQAVNEMVQHNFASFSLDHPGYRLHFGGEFEKTAESFRSLFLLLPVALLGIIMILATQFNSIVQALVVMITVPCSFIGVVIGLLVMGYDFSIPAMTGIISLMGLVVNNSLVMVDFINKSRLRGVDRWFSIVRSGVIRMRPILLTTITTIVGLSSLTYATTGASKILVPMAVSMIWGLAFATVLTLFLIPALVAVVDDMGMRFRVGRTWRQYGGGDRRV